MKKTVLIMVALSFFALNASNEKAIEVLKNNNMEMISDSEMLVIRIKGHTLRPFLMITKGSKVMKPDFFEEMREEEKVPQKAHNSSSLDHFFSKVQKRIVRDGELSTRQYRFKLDQDCDGNIDFQIAPGGYDFEPSGETGVSVNAISTFGEYKIMPIYDRFEVKLFTAHTEGSVLNKLSFRIDRVVVRLHSDGNLQITLRDSTGKTGRDVVVKTEFDW